MRIAQREEMDAKIKSHGQTLKAIFDLPITADPVALAKKVRRIEVAANRKAEDYCNGVIDCEAWELYETKTLLKLSKILNGFDGIPVLINSDPRGYALKIDDVYGIDDREAFRAMGLTTDWGGYGILAPDFTPVDV